MTSVHIHASACIDQPCEIGAGTRIWHFCHVMQQARIGEHCTLGQNVFVAEGVRIGNHVKIQNNVSVYAGVTVEDEVFLGPSCVFTNVLNPRAELNRHGDYLPTLVRRGATVGANATILCGVTIGMYAFIAAGAVVTRDVPDYALIAGVPGEQKGWMSRHGARLQEQKTEGMLHCSISGWQYEKTPTGLRCINWPEDKPLVSSTTL